jgi:hypothetical protein
VRKGTRMGTGGDQTKVTRFCAGFILGEFVFPGWACQCRVGPGFKSPKARLEVALNLR